MRVGPISNPQPLKNRHNRQGHSSRLITTSIIRRTRHRKQAYKNPSNALIIDIIDSILSPFVIQNAHDEKEATALIPASLDGAAQGKRQGC